LTKKFALNLSELTNWLKTIERKKQIIFQGSPGTGKTFLAQYLAQYLTHDTSGFFELIQFHPNYAYEDFIQGIRPQINSNGQLEYKTISGHFLEFCHQAKQCNDLCILIIDEINRANLSQVFGELMYLLEYRDQEIKLAGTNCYFKIPENVRIIGTMNTADRSIALVDHALRRRFAFITIKPNYNLLRQYHQGNNGLLIEILIKILQQLNQAINDPHYEVGVSFFLSPNLAEDLENIWTLEIEPYLEEYFFDQLDKIDQFRWDKVKMALFSS
jgi:5-methylcytosine-specific restriction protein B